VNAPGIRELSVHLTGAIVPADHTVVRHLESRGRSRAEAGGLALLPEAHAGRLVIPVATGLCHWGQHCEPPPGG
jgi:hypothetical protein